MSTLQTHRPNRRTSALTALMMGAALMFTGAAVAGPQSKQLSNASAASLTASMHVPKAGLEALSAGGQFVVVAVQASAHGVEVVVRSSATGVSVAIQSTAEWVKGVGLTVGASVYVSVLISGYLLVGEDGRFYGFIPNERTRQQIHSREVA